MRKSGNDLIEKIITKWIKLADSEVIKQGAQFNNNNYPSLETHLCKQLKREETKEYVGSLGAQQSGKYGLQIFKRSRAKLKTILPTLQEWNKISNGNVHKINTSIQYWPTSITLGLVRPEGANLIPINEQCALDSGSWAGWTPAIYHKLLTKWIFKFKHVFKNKEDFLTLRHKLYAAYKRLRTALYTLADSLHPSSCQATSP